MLRGDPHAQIGAGVQLRRGVCGPGRMQGLPGPLAAELNVTFPLVMVTLADGCWTARWAVPAPLHEVASSRPATPAPATMHRFGPQWTSLRTVREMSPGIELPP